MRRAHEVADERATRHNARQVRIIGRKPKSAGRYRKMRGLDCGRSCCLCHAEKILDIPTLKEQRHARWREEGAEEMEWQAYDEAMAGYEEQR